MTRPFLLTGLHTAHVGESWCLVLARRPLEWSGKIKWQVYINLYQGPLSVFYTTWIQLCAVSPHRSRMRLLMVKREWLTLTNDPTGILTYAQRFVKNVIYLNVWHFWCSDWTKISSKTEAICRSVLVFYRCPGSHWPQTEIPSRMASILDHCVPRLWFRYPTPSQNALWQLSEFL